MLHPHSAEHGPSAARFGERRRVCGAHGAAASDGGADGADGGGRGTAEGSARAVAGGTGGTAGVGRCGEMGRDPGIGLRIGAAIVCQCSMIILNC